MAIMWSKGSMYIIFPLVILAMANSAAANCRNPLPAAQPFALPSAQFCPSGYSQTGNMCAPTGSARFAFVLPAGEFCPSGYSQTGRVCMASSGSACHAFVGGGSSCPSGYSQTGQVCRSN